MVVFANKWTGAAAVAELSCRSLRAVGVDAKLLFVGGRNLERRLAGRTWSRPDLIKERTPRQFLSNIRAVRDLAKNSNTVICHLPHDHLLCVAAGVHHRVPLVRAFRNPRHIRRDPYHRMLGSRLAAALPAFAALEDELEGIHGPLPTAVLPVPVEDRFRPVDGTAQRAGLGIPHDAPTLGMVGKLARGRGFELLLRVASRCAAAPHVIVVGHGELQNELQTRAAALGIAERIHWTGYRDTTLPELFAAMDVVLFLAPGSDWGHRAVSEAQACARPVVAVSTPGLEDLVEDGVSGRVVDRDPEALTDAVVHLMTDAEAAHRLGDAAMSAAAERRPALVGGDLARFFDDVLSTHPPSSPRGRLARSDGNLA